MFLYYKLFLKDKTFHHYNRFYLLFTVLISLFLPLVKIEYFTIEVNKNWYLLLEKFKTFNTDKNLDNGDIYFKIIFSALGLVSFFFLGRLLVGITKIQRLKNQFPKENFHGVNFFLTNLTDAPFSFFRNLFWKKSIDLQSNLGQQILKHEMVHIEQKHSLDKIFIEIITSIFWFNPIFYIIKKEIGLIHEYLADNKAVKKSDTKAFAQMLLASHFSSTPLPATSPFLSSNIKKRLKMLQKPNTKYGYARRIFALPVLFTVAFAYMVNAKNKEIEKVNVQIQEAVETLKIADNELAEKSSKKDTIIPKKNQLESKSETVTLVDNLENKENHPFQKVLKTSSSEDIYLINGEKVNKKEFEDFFSKNKNTSNYMFSKTGEKLNSEQKIIYSAENTKDDSARLEAKKYYKVNNINKEGVEFYFNAYTVKPEEREALKQKVLEAYKAKKESEKANLETQNEYKDFFEKAENARQNAILLRAKNRKDLQETINEKRLNSKVFKKLYPGRDYEKNPLSKKEIKILKKEAEEIKILAEKQSKEFINSDDYVFFRSFGTETKLYDINGKEIPKNEPKVSIKSDLMGISVNGADLYVNGRKVDKEEFLKYKTDFKDFKKENAIPNIKVLKIDRVGNDKISYAKKMEIITDNLDADDFVRYYVNGKQATKSEIDKILPNTISRMDVDKSNDNGKKRSTIKIQTK